MISAGVQLNQIPDFGQSVRRPTAGNVLGASVGQQLGSTSAEFIRRGMTVAPTLEIQPAYPFNVIVTRDVVFPRPYGDKEAALKLDRLSKDRPAVSMPLEAPGEVSSVLMSWAPSRRTPAR